MPSDAAPLTPMTPSALFAYFDAQGLSYSNVEHPPVFTVDEGAAIKARIPGGHSKNLFLKSKSGSLFLVSAKDDAKINLNRLHKALDCDRLSFGAAELMLQTLGVKPGSVTAFALVNDSAQKVQFFLDQALWDCDPINFHPLANTGTTSMKRADFGRFLAGLHRPLQLLNFSAEGDPVLIQG